MPRLEMEITSPKSDSRQILLADLPDIDGTYPTAMGNITIAMEPNKLIVTSDILKGSPSRNRVRRTTTKKVSLGWGHGAQTISKRERLHVEMLKNRDTQLHLPYGMSAENDNYNGLVDLNRGAIEE